MKLEDIYILNDVTAYAIKDKTQNSCSFPYVCLIWSSCKAQKVRKGLLGQRGLDSKELVQYIRCQSRKENIGSQNFKQGQKMREGSRWERLTKIETV